MHSKKNGRRQRRAGTGRAGLSILTIMGVGLIGSALAFEPTVVTFDQGKQGWESPGVCGPVRTIDGNPGAHWNVANRECDSDDPILSGWFMLRNDKNPAFVGDFRNKGPVRISIDVDVTDFSYEGSPVEQWRQVVFEFIDHDDPYTDPNTGAYWPYTSVIYPAGYLPLRDAGWKTFSVDIADPNATELPQGWTGFGGPEDANWLPQLPPGRTFADVMAGVDEIQIHNIEPGYWYDFNHTYDIKFDNISITELPKGCGGREATVWVDDNGIVHGGELAGASYNGQLNGTRGDDVIVGTNGDDSIQGLHGDDVICGLDGNDRINGDLGNDVIFGGNGDDVITGQAGDDRLDGGIGRDIINGGPGNNDCSGGEVVTACGTGRGRP